MRSKERILRTLQFELPDRIGRHHHYWMEFIDKVRIEKGKPDLDVQAYYNEDIFLLYPDEGPFPSLRNDSLRTDGKSLYSRDSWGRIFRQASQAKFIEVLDTAVKDKTDLDSLVFESPYLDRRFSEYTDVESIKSRYCAMLKMGGFFQRTSWLRGEEQFLMDIALDESFAGALADRTAEHILSVAREALRRWDLYDTAVWLFDDIGTTRGPILSPDSFERIFLPAYKYMINGLRSSGIKNIILHSDGNIESLLDLYIEAGINGINPVEPRSGMDIEKIRAKFGSKLSFIGGIDNVHVLPSGDRKEIERMTRRVIDLAQDGGVVIGAHSVGTDIAIEDYEYYISLIHRYGGFGRAV